MPWSSDTPAARRALWWRWLVLPFSLAIFLISAVPLLLFLVIAIPIAKVRGWRQNRRITQRLQAVGRELEWPDALHRFQSGGHQFLMELSTNDKRHTLWLVPLSPSESETFGILPTYCQFDANARDTLGTLTKLDQHSLERLVPVLKEAIRVKNSSSYVRDAIIRFKDSMRIILVWQKESPSALLHGLVS
jgi:hypothetical protein